jgi:tripartite-type tricarboxylate transporter receptor subunit TctC
LPCCWRSCSSVALAQAYPNRAVRLIIPFPARRQQRRGRPRDRRAASERLGQQRGVENRGGGGGTLGINAAAKSPPDGYTLLLISVGYPVSIALGPMPRESMQWFTPVAAIGAGRASWWCRRSPGQLGAGSDRARQARARRAQRGAAGPGSFQHLATELFRLQAGIDIVIVQYKGGGPALTDTIAGRCR